MDLIYSLREPEAVSDAKFAAARELIQEKRYDLARQLLKTIDDPKADQWLGKLERIAPAAKQSSLEAEQHRYYRARNRSRRRRNIGDGIETFLGGLVSLAIFGWWLYADLQDGTLTTTWVLCLLPMGALGMLIGIVLMRRD